MSNRWPSVRRPDLVVGLLAQSLRVGEPREREETLRGMSFIVDSSICCDWRSFRCEYDLPANTAVSFNHLG